MQLSICIPTYNRASKLERVVSLFIAQIVAANLQDCVDIVISDNASTDETASVCQRLLARAGAVQIAIHRQTTNLGFPGNVRALYDLASGDYVWYFSDDDLPKPHAVATIWETLQEHQPTVLLFSFEQPVGHVIRCFAFPDKVTIIRDPTVCVRSLFDCFKLSIYVLRRTALTVESKRFVANVGSNEWFGFLTFPYAVLCDDPAPSLAIISTVLASSDDESQSNWRFQPLNWKKEADLFRHPPLGQYDIEFTRDPEGFMYRKAIHALWSWRTGHFEVAASVERQWWAAIKDLPIRLAHTKDVKRTVALMILKLWPARGPRLARWLWESLRPASRSNKQPVIGLEQEAQQYDKAA